VGGGAREVLTEPTLVGNTVLVQAGYDGEWLGTLEISFDAAGKASTPTMQLIPLGPEIDSDPALAAIVAKYQPEATPTPKP
jgi:2',3'-cyclic-nucleotide 2'-phosphodiesterase (5'-nucleotidase family)